MKKILLFFILIFVLLIAFLMTYQINKDKIMNSFNKDNILAIYVDGVETSTIPSQTSGYEFDKAICNNGTIVDWDYDNWALDMSFTTKTKCDLYFVNSFKLRGTSTNVLSQFAEYNDSLDVIDKGWLNTFGYDLTTDNNLRYVGADPKNYVQFNGELWRIIGVMNNVENSTGQTQSLFKIVRSESLGKYSWDSSKNPNGNNGYGINQWGESTYEDGTLYEGSDLMRELNTDYLGNITIGTDGYWYGGRDNQKNADMPTTFLNAESQSMIESVVWHLGSPGNDNGTFSLSLENSLTPSLAYDGERADTNGKTCTSGNYCDDLVVRTSNWTGKVALFYLSDFGFATSGGSTINRGECLNLSFDSMFGDWGSNDKECLKNTWFFNKTIQWVLTSRAYPTSGDTVQRIMDSSGVASDAAFVKQNVRPVVFLKSNISITGGSGAKFDPYILSNTTTT